MRPKACPSTSRSIARHLILMSALVVGLGLALTAQAFAQTLQVNINTKSTRSVGCPNGDYLCGTANIAGYGAATWNYFVVEATLTPPSTTCGTYQADSMFTLASDGSTLTLSESGVFCFVSHPSKGFGNPNYITGTWTASGTGPSFAGVTGSGIDTLRGAGAHVSGSYSGSLG